MSLVKKYPITQTLHAAANDKEGLWTNRLKAHDAEIKMSLKNVKLRAEGVGPAGCS